MRPLEKEPMRTLKQALADHELIVLRVIGEWWELDLTGSDKTSSVNELAITLENLNMTMERDHSPPEEADALNALIANNGRMPVAIFARDHGDVRMMGPGKLEREEPWFDPQNAAEALWYRGMLYRGFDDTAEGLIEFYYLPSELYAQFDESGGAPEPSDSAPIVEELAEDDEIEVEDEEDQEEESFSGELEYADEDEHTPEFEEDPPPEFDESGGEAAKAQKQRSYEPIGTEEDEPTFGKGPLPDYPKPKAAIRNIPEPEYVPLDNQGVEQIDDSDSADTPQKQSAKILTAVEPPKSVPKERVDTVDDLTSILIMAQKIGLDKETSAELDKYLVDKDPERRSLLINLALEMEMVKQTPNGLRTTRTAVNWLQQSRERQLREIADAWSRSMWNELRHTPEIQCEGENWENDPILARNGLLEAIPRNIKWFKIHDLVQNMKLKMPDFQRPDGNFDTWYIRDKATQQYISGFDNWELVEGRLIAFLLKGPLTWLGLIITAETPQGPCFSATDRLLEWVSESEPPKDKTRQPLTIQSEGLIKVTNNADRYHRFQAARISDPIPITSENTFFYRLTPNALSSAQKQGITPDRVQQFLETASGKALPAGVKRAINRWSENGIEGRLETVAVLRVRDAEIMQTLRTNPKTRDFIGESLGNLAATVKLEHRDALHAAVVQLGLLLDVEM